MTDTFLPSPAIDGLSDVRTGDSVLAGTLASDTKTLKTPGPPHALHQLEYALEGVAEVETSAGRYLAPPHQAIWIPSGLEHNTTLRETRSAAVFLHPAAMTGRFNDRARVLAAAPLLREMIVYALRWPLHRPEPTPPAAVSFSALPLGLAD